MGINLFLFDGILVRQETLEIAGTLEAGVLLELLIVKCHVKKSDCVLIKDSELLKTMITQEAIDRARARLLEIGFITITQEPTDEDMHVGYCLCNSKINNAIAEYFYGDPEDFDIQYASSEVEKQ